MIQYPWHPLHGQELEVCGRHVRAAEASLLVVLPDGTKAEVPEWMAKPEAGIGAELAHEAAPSLVALKALRRLIDGLRADDDCGDDFENRPSTASGGSP